MNIEQIELTKLENDSVYMLKFSVPVPTNRMVAMQEHLNNVVKKSGLVNTQIVLLPHNIDGVKL